MAKKKTPRSGIDDLLKKLGPVTPEHLVFGRREIVRSEIHSAIRLIFEHRDFVSAHLLASAASEILRQLESSASTETIRTRLHRDLKSAGYDESVISEISAFLDLPYNFFKHSSKVPEAKIHFKPEYVEVSIYHSVADYRSVFNELTPVMTVYAGVFMARHPGSFPNLPPDAVTLFAALGLQDCTLNEALNFGARQLRQIER